MSGNFNTRTARLFNFFTAILLLLSTVFGATNKVMAQTYPPSITVEPDHDWVQGLDWAVGSNILLTIDNDADLDNGFLYQEFKPVSEYAIWDPTRPIVMFYLGSIFDIQPGHHITMTDGVTPKSHWVETVYFDELDEEVDTAQGRGPANRNASVQVWTDTAHYFLVLTIEAGGTWFADFAAQGNDLVNVQNAHVQVYDNDWDVTMAHWSLSSSADPLFDCVNVNQIPQSECEALVALYNSTNGPNWSNNTGWLQTNTPCSWNGVQCEADNVSKLFLANNQLNGTIPLEMGSLTFVRELYLDNNHQITGTFPSGLRNLVKLETLRLHHTQISGSIPAWIGELTHLQRLHLEDNQLSGSIPVELTTLTSLQTLNISMNQLTGPIPEQFSNMISLKQVYLGGNQFSGGFPVQFTVLPELDILHLYNSGLDGMLPAEMGDFPAITSLDLSNNGFSGPIPVEIGELSTLRQLWLGHNALSGDIPVSITYLTNLNLLDLTCNRLISTEPAVQSFLDSTSPGWQTAQCFPDITIVARLTQNEVDASGWPLGTLLTLTVEDPQTDTSPDYSDSAPAGSNDPDAGTNVNFFFGEDYTLKPGDVVTVTGGDFTRTTTVANIQVTQMDVDNDIISGTAGPGIDSVNIRIWGIPFEMQRDAVVVDGVWSADFSIPSQDFEEYDLKPGDNGVVRWFEGDGDFTTNYWEIPNPTIGASVRGNYIFGDRWPIGDTVTLTIDDPSTSPESDYQVQLVAGPAPWNPFQGHVFHFPVNFQIQPGYIIGMTASEFAKSLTVTYIEITSVDVFSDTVSGLADVSTEVFVFMEGEPFGFTQRRVVSNPDGSWSVDFSEPDPNDNENVIVDIKPGMGVGAARLEPDGDITEDSFNVVTPSCQPGNTVSGNVFEHDGFTPVPNAYLQFEDFATGEVLLTTVTDADGLYGCALPPGSYRILAWPNSGYSTEYYLEAASDNAVELQIAADTQLSGINFTVSPLPLVEHLTFNMGNALLQDPVIRQAIALGTNRQQILTGAFLPNYNFGTVLDSIVPSEHWASAPVTELETYPFDPTQAQTLLATAGWVDLDNDGFRENPQNVELAFTFRTTDASARIVAAEIFRQNMESIGIRITVETMPAGEFFGAGGVLDQRAFDIAEYAWTGGLDNEPYLGEYRTGNPSNVGDYSNPAFDAAIASARSEGNDAGKLPYLYEAQAILSQDLPVFPLFTRYDVVPVSTNPGSDITISPETYLDIRFEEVLEGGVTTVLPLNIDPADLPPNFQVLDLVYEIGTSAQFTSAQVCFRYDNARLVQAQEEAIRLLHLENGTWVDVTDEGYPDTENNLVCGTVDRFSPFAIVYSLNQAPRIISLTAPQVPTLIGQSIIATVTFIDPDMDDSHTVLWDWGDGTASTMPVTSSTVSTVHTYALPGVYTVTVNVTDAAGEVDAEVFQYVVIYDPNGGFVTGGGWIWSPEGAYTPDPSLTGKATFGFVSKYQKGANVPTGNTEFQFKVADLNFKSTSYDWLVIAGSKAQYKGTGTINGEGEYKFMLTATDGSPDKFCIKIWDKATGEVIYDNQLGASDTADPITAIQGGSIVVHKSK